ncbi:hypothetical protein AAKU55_005418 [Oxalobacteraceae bacterium GrIS 1.11]
MSDFDFSPRHEAQPAISPEQREAALQAKRNAYAALSPEQKDEFVATFELLRAAAIAHRARLVDASAKQAIQRAQRGG